MSKTVWGVVIFAVTMLAVVYVVNYFELLGKGKTLNDFGRKTA